MEMANLEIIVVSRKIHFENKNAPSKNMSPQHVKVCSQKWRQLSCSAVGRSVNLGREKKNF